jgi:hypothetical protein
MPVWAPVVASIGLIGVAAGTCACFQCGLRKKRLMVSAAESDSPKRKWRLDKLKHLLSANKKLAQQSLQHDHEFDHVQRKASYKMTSHIVQDVRRMSRKVSSFAYSVLGGRDQSTSSSSAVCMYVCVCICVYLFFVCVNYGCVFVCMYRCSVLGGRDHMQMNTSI